LGGCFFHFTLVITDKIAGNLYSGPFGFFFFLVSFLVIFFNKIQHSNLKRS